MNEFKLKNLPHLEKYRKKLRKNQTPAESLLWKFIKGNQIKDTRFRRQFSIGNYILDFYCRKLKLGIELDGNSHFTETGLEKDKERDKYLNELGITIMRFENDLVMKRTETVLSLIEEKIEELNTTPLSRASTSIE
jgi:very-short-patch-repair endonuclease